MGSAALDTAVAAALGADATLATLAPGGVWQDLAPADAREPVVVFSLEQGQDDYAMGRRLERGRYRVLVAGTQPVAPSVRSAADRIDAVLQDTTLTVTGYTGVSLRRLSRAATVDVDGDDRYLVLTQTYELVAERT